SEPTRLRRRRPARTIGHDTPDPSSTIQLTRSHAVGLVRLPTTPSFEPGRSVGGKPAVFVEITGGVSLGAPARHLTGRISSCRRSRPRRRRPRSPRHATPATCSRRRLRRLPPPASPPPPHP